MPYDPEIVLPHLAPLRTVLNTHWPARPLDFEDRWPGIPVTVRIVWEEHGEEFLEGTAKRWGAGHVYVEVFDKRLETNGVWVKPRDVYRREPDRPSDQ